MKKNKFNNNNINNNNNNAVLIFYKFKKVFNIKTNKYSSFTFMKIDENDLAF
jgi:hypothetical protein